MAIQLLLFIFYIMMLVMLDRCMSKKNGRGFYVNFPQLFQIALIAYTVLPMFDCIVNQKDTPYIVPFLLQCILIVFSLMIGYLLGTGNKNRIRLRGKSPRTYYLSIEKQMFWTTFWGVVVIAFMAINILFNRGGLSSALNASYRESYVDGSSTIIAFLEFSAMPYALVFNDKRLIRDKRIRKVAIIITLIIIGLHFLLGNRNLAVMVGFALAWSMFRDKRFNKATIYFLMVGGVVFLGIVAVMREYSIILVLRGQVSIDWNLARQYAFSFANGELGTMFAFEKYKSRIVSGFRFPYGFGYSYIILPILNLVPSAIWGEKPMAYADYYSHYAFGVFDGIGYGFSPLYEAQVNFGFMWWIVFVVVGYFIARCNTNDNNMGKCYNVGLVACLMLNFFRIDFTTCFKFFVMMWVFKWVYLKSFKFNLVSSHSYTRYYVEAEK